MMVMMIIIHDDYYVNHDNENDIVLWCVKLEKYSEPSITTTALKINTIDDKYCQSSLFVPSSHPGLSTEGRATNTVFDKFQSYVQSLLRRGQWKGIPEDENVERSSTLRATILMASGMLRSTKFAQQLPWSSYKKEGKIRSWKWNVFLHSIRTQQI